ncbi:MAG TPA: flippase [Niallia sp.]|nr:flippase [Niallia sp.]
MKLILKNASYLFASNVIVRLISAFATILVARYLGATDYGILSIGLAIATIAGYFTDMGLSHTFIREATKEEKVDLPSLVGSHFKIRLIFVGIVGVILFVLVESLYSNQYMKKIIYLMTYPTIIGAALQGVGVVYFQAVQQMHYTAYIRILSGIVTATTLVLGLLFKWPLTLLAAAYGFSSLIGGLYSIYLLTRRTSLLRGWDRNLLDGLISYTLGGLFVMMLPQVPSIVLEKVTSLKEVGYFSAAYRIPLVLYQVPGIVAAAFYPMLFKYGSSGQTQKHLKMSIIQTKIMSILGVCMVLPFLLYSDWWVNLVFGKEWSNVTPLLSILSVVVLLQSINFPLADSLTTRGYQSKRTLVMFVSLVLAIFCYYFLGQKYNSLGGAMTVVIIEILLLIGFTLFNIKFSIQILKKGTLLNLLSFGLTILLSLIVKKYFHPIVGSSFFVCLFLGLTIYVDKELRSLFLQFVKRRMEKWRTT